MLMQASHQWMTRPDDERFTSLDELLAFTRAQREISASDVVASRGMRVEPFSDHKGLALIPKKDDQPVQPTHWAFGQLCSLMGAPAKYLRTLPAELVADNLNYGAFARDIESVGILTRINGQHELAAATGPDYGRVWNADVIQALKDRFGDGVTGDFTVPGEFGVALDEVTKANTTLYASDRDMFVFLADEKNRIEVPNRRGGQPGQLARGFFVWNSEVGSASLGIATFLFDYVCMNRIVWGPTEYREVRVRHSKGAPLRFLDEVRPALEAYAHSSSISITQALDKARETRLGGDELEAFLANRFSINQAKAITAVHLAEEDRPIENLLDVTNAITAYARRIPHQDARVQIERMGGKVLELAARQ